MLLGRDDDLAVLDDAVAAAVASSGRVVIIEGPAGIGRTRLLAEVRGRAAGAMEVLSARGSELERDFPFGVVRQLFERAVAGRALEGGAEPAGAVFASVGGAGASFATLLGLQWLALDLAEARPLLLTVDDLQWCDEPSLRFLAYLSRRLEGAPILLAATLRTTDPGSALVAELTADAFTTVVARRR